MNEVLEKGDINKKNDKSSKSVHTNQNKLTIPITKIIVAAVIVVVAIGSFSLGMMYQNHRDKSLHATQFMKSQMGGVGIYGNGRTGVQHRLGVFGTVTSISGTTITISDLRSGADKSYTITSTTKFSDNGQSIAASDLQAGETVMIMVSSTDSNTASYITVNPSFGSPMMSGGSATAN